jgi:transitional endoplasmic reticulum ATPase
VVVFCEDIDRQVSGDRTEDMDQILNTLDGIDNKSNELIVIFTTNHLENINPAMLRPGRLDVILNIQPPDSEACERLVRKYANGLLSKETTLTEIGQALAGYTPAIIREVVERAKLFTISRAGKLNTLSEKDILLAAASMKQQQALLAPKAVENKTWGDLMLEDIRTATDAEQVAKKVAEIRERV